MRKTQKQQKSPADFAKIVADFYSKSQRFKEIEVSFKKIKSKFSGEISKYFDENPDLKSAIFTANNDSDVECTGYIVNKIQRANVKFDCDKLEKALGKKLSDVLIFKTYSIIDMPGLISYLKECNVDPQIFKSFLHVEKYVDKAQLERLEGIGKLTQEDIQGCYTVELSEPYYKVSLQKAKDEWQEK